MAKITVGVLTVSDRCAKGEAEDESGPNLAKVIKAGAIENAEVVKVQLVADDEEKIQECLRQWSDEGIHVILTTGGTGIGSRDVTPEATVPLLEKEISGVTNLIFNESSKVTLLAALSRGKCGVRKKSLILNLPGSKKASMECLRSAARVIPHAVDLILGSEDKVAGVHSSLALQTRRKSKVEAGNPANRCRISPYPSISVTDAQTIILDRMFLMRREKMVRFDEAFGYVLAQEVVARDDLPAFSVSLRDGYAVQGNDNLLDHKVVIGFSSAGNPLPQDLVVGKGQCVRVNTGAVIPRGADAVVPVEKTEIVLLSEDRKEESKIKINSWPAKDTFIRPKGSEFSVGNLLLKTGTYLDAAAVGLLTAAGYSSVRVFSSPLVAILSTGDELLEATEQLQPGKIRDINRVVLATLLKKNGFSSLDLGIASDYPDSLCAALEKGFREADVVVTTGSMSMGDRDYLKDVLVSDFGAEILFGRVNMKPGKPTALALLSFEGQPKLWFGLPGNPASAYVTAHLFLLPALRKIAGHSAVLPLTLFASVNVPKVKDEDPRPQYLRGILKWNYTLGWAVTLQQDQTSTRIESCLHSNCLVQSDNTQQSIPNYVQSDSTQQSTQKYVQSNSIFGSTTKHLQGADTTPIKYLVHVTDNPFEPRN